MRAAEIDAVGLARPALQRAHQMMTASQPRNTPASCAGSHTSTSTTSTVGSMNRCLARSRRRVVTTTRLP